MLVPRTGNPRSARGRAAPQGTAGRGLAPGDGAYEYECVWEEEGPLTKIIQKSHGASK